MKFLNSLFLLFFSCSFSTNEAQNTEIGIKNDNKNLFDNIKGIYFMPQSELEKKTSPKRGLVFHNNKSFQGYDGCNTFYGEFSFDEKQEKFQIKSIKSTELRCRNNDDLFKTDFFYATKSFEIKNNGIIFYDKDKKVVNALFSLVDLDKTPLNIPIGKWKMTKSNSQFFEMVYKNKCEPHIEITKNRRFVLCYDKNKKENWKKTNYLEGYSNFNQNTVFFYTDASVSVGQDLEGNDGELAHLVLYAQNWTLENNTLTLKNGETFFIFEKI